MKHPILLDDALAPVRFLDVQSAEITLHAAEPARAVLCLSPGETILPRALVRLFAPSGDAALCRVTEVMTDTAEGTRVTLEGLWGCLADTVLPEGDLLLEGSVSHVVTRLLDAQPPGALRIAAGMIDLAEDIAVDCGGQSVLDVLLTILAEFPECGVTLRESPLRLDVCPMGAVSSEGRISRNVSRAKVSIRDGELCTRVISSRLPEGSLTGAAAATHGIIARRLDLPENCTEGTALAAARRFLANRAAPAVSCELTARDLQSLTGEALDHISPGTAFRLALPEHGIALVQRITEMHWDADGECRVLLASRQESMRLRLARLLRETAALSARERLTAGRSRGNRKQIDENSGLISDARIEIDRTNARILLLATQEEVTDIKDRMSRAGIRIDGAAAEVEVLAAQSEVDKLSGRVNSAEASIKVNADNISLKVNKNGVISAINQSAESISISASKINLSGYVTTSQLSALNTKVNNLMTGETTASRLSASSLRLAGYSLYLGSITVDGVSYAVVRYGGGD